MASPAKIADTLPETLPETFNDWDLEVGHDTAQREVPPDPTTSSITIDNSKQPEQKASHDGTLTSYADFDEFFRDQKAIHKLVDKLHTSTSDSRTADESKSAPPVKADPIINSGVSVTAIKPLKDLEIVSGPFPVIPWKVDLSTEKRTDRRRLVMIACVSTVAILLVVLLFPRFNSGKKSIEGQVAQPSSRKADPDQQTSKNEGVQSASPAPVTFQIAGKQPKATTRKEVRQQDGSVSQAKSKVMTYQLAAPARISQDVKKRFAENSPPPTGLAMISAEGMAGSGTNQTIFTGQHSQPVVQVSPSNPVNISSGVASGMLIQKTKPIYPQIAQTAHITGTVQLHAIISKTGTIKDLRVLSGPALFRQSAVDAVRTWRYKPYQLNNQPTEVETTINVVFSTGG